MYQLVLRFARKLKLKPGKEGIMQISNNQEVIDTANDILTTFKKHGVPNEIIKTENDVKTIYNQILNIEDQQLRKNVISPGDPRYKEVTEKIFGKKAGEVVDMSGKTIQKPETIMGGMEGIKARNTKIQGLAAQLAKMQKEKSAMYGKKPTDAELKSKLEGMNKKTIDRIRRRRYEAALKAEREKMAKDPYYIPKILDPEDFAQGGRTGTGLNYLLGEDDQNSRVPYSTAGRVIEKTIAAGPERANIPAIEKILDAAGAGVGISTIGLPKWLLSKISERMIQGKIRKKFFNEHKDERMGEARQMLTAQDPYIGLAEGGRIGFGIGGMGRRAFLKMMGAGAAGIGAAKSGLFGLLKAGKPAAVETLTSVPIGSAEGMPAWFKPLVNKVIREGEDVTKKLATKEREIVHTKKLDDVDEVTVIQDLDTGSIRVEYQGQGSFGDGPIQLEYTAGEIIEQGSKKGTKTKPNFSAVEEDYYPVTTSPDGDFDIEFTENIVNKVDDLYSDTSKLKEFATGKNLTIKEISESMKKRNYLKEVEKNPNEHAFRNAPDAEWDDSLDFASGGRVPLDEGGITSRVPYWKGGSWKMIKEALKHNKVFGLGGPPYKPGKTSLDIKQLTKDRFGTELSLKDLKEMVSGSNIHPGISPRQFKEAKETLPKFLGGFKEYKADVIKAQLMDSKQSTEISIKVAKDLLENIPEGMDPAMANKVYKQMIKQDTQRLKDIEKALKDIDIYKAMTEKTGVASHAQGGRVPLDGGGEVIDMDWGEDPDEWEEILKALKDRTREGLGRYQTGGRVPFIFGGGAIKNVFKRLKDMRKIPHTEKLMKPKFQHLLTEADKLELSELRIEHAEAMLDMLKSDRDLFLQFQKNKAMKDPGLDFLMKKMLEPMAPHINQYKSLKEIDEAILNMEMIVKNKIMKEGRQLNATGGRVPRSGGGIMKLLNLLKKKPKKPFNVKDFASKREAILSLIGQSQKQRNKRILAEYGEKMKKKHHFKGYEWPSEKEMEARFQQILAKHSTKHADGGLAGMLGE